MKYYRKIFMGAMSLLLLVTTFTTTTYAWFKINSSASVSGFDFQVNGGEGFQVSVDGIHYYRDLTLNQIKQAILISYDGDTYSIQNEKLMYSESNTEVSSESIDQIINQNILLLPRTSTDGIQLEDLYGASALAKDGSFVEFGVYFKTTSTKAEDEMRYDIYLSGQEVLLNDGTTVSPTRIESAEKTDVILKAAMCTASGNLQAGDTITVYSSNAMRMSVQDTSLETPSATIYELTNEYDLGSYATDYSGENEELNRLYNADMNAMYTYYNNLRPSAQIKKLDYEQTPQTIRSLTGDIPKITTVESGANANLITFRFWLEGWDADCFDGLDKSIRVKLSFTSKRVEN